MQFALRLPHIGFAPRPSIAVALRLPHIGFARGLLLPLRCGFAASM
jgi:hypothetical protein